VQTKELSLKEAALVVSASSRSQVSAHRKVLAAILTIMFANKNAATTTNALETRNAVSMEWATVAPIQLDRALLSIALLFFALLVSKKMPTAAQLVNVPPVTFQTAIWLATLTKKTRTAALCANVNKIIVTHHLAIWLVTPTKKTQTAVRCVNVNKKLVTCQLVLWLVTLSKLTQTAVRCVNVNKILVAHHLAIWLVTLTKKTQTVVRCVNVNKTPATNQFVTWLVMFTKLMRTVVSCVNAKK